jgi:muramoyltetrapeptide carboxypeptidase
MKVGIFATSSPVTSSLNETSYEYLKQEGFNIFEHPQVRITTGHTAGSITQRVDALHEMIMDSSIDLLMAYWGGANTNELLPYINYSLFNDYPKPIIGFSDTSSLLLAINKHSGIKTYLGPAAITFEKPQPFEYTFNYLLKIIEGKKDSIIEVKDSTHFADDLSFLRPDSNYRIIKNNKGRKVLKPGSATGRIIASNLQTLMVLSGTIYFPELENKVLFIEEAEEENTSMIHRFLTHLTQVTDLNKLKAICIGRFCSQSGFNDSDSEEMLLTDVFKQINIPILYNLDFGHSDPMFTIPIGGYCEINTEKNIFNFVRFVN